MLRPPYSANEELVHQIVRSRNDLVKLLVAFSFGDLFSPSEDQAQILLEGVHTPYCRNCVDHLVDMRILPVRERI